MGGYSFVILFLFAIWSCSKSSDSSVNVEDKTALVFLEKATKKQNSEALELPAIVLSKVNASLKTSLSGTVYKVLKNVGDKVAKGEALLEIRHNDPAFEYRPFFLRATMSGRISEMMAAQGSLVQAGDVLVRLIDETSVELLVQVPGRDLKRLQKLERVVWVDDPKIELKLTQLSPSLNIETGTAQAVFQFQSKKIPVGLSVGAVSSLRLTFKAQSSIWVDADSVVYRQDKPFVRKIVDGKLRWKEVKIGEQQAEQIEIVEGVQDQEAIVMRASRYVPDGELVKIFEEKAQAEDGLAR